MDAATLWRTRVTWALVGAGVALAITGLREREGGEAEATVASPRAPTREASVQAPAIATSEAVAPVATPSDPAAGTAALAPDPTPAAVPSPAAVPTPAAVPAPAAVPSPAAVPAPAAVPTPAAAPAEAFEIPLPLMPGARVMTRGQRPDEELGGTIYTLTVSVPAPGMQVESFYRRALADAKLSVSGGSAEPSTIGSGLRTSLRGRGRDASVHVNLQQRAGKLRTTVRIIWRTLP